MQKLLKLIGHRSSKSDRWVIKGLLIVCGLIVVAAGLIAFFILRDAVWDPQIKRDRIKLDSILSKEKIDTVEIRSWGRNGTETIKLIDGEAFQFVASLHQTNRINNIDWTKQQQEEVVLFKGIDEVCRLHKGEDGAWEFEKYGFRLRK